MAATEDRLWVVRITNGRSIVSYREPIGPWQPGKEPLQTPIVSLTAAGSDAYAFLEDGSFYRYSDGWRPAVDLRARQRPVHVIAVNLALYALVSSPVAEQLPLADLSQTAPSSRPFDAGEAPLSIVRYDSRGWSAVAACPALARAAAPPGLAPRLCHAGGRLLLCWVFAQPPQVAYTWLDLSTNRWMPGGTLGPAHLRAFWVPVVNRVPTLVAAVGREGAGEDLVFYRLLGDLDSRADDAWRPEKLELSPLPENIGLVHCLDAFGFNQHLGILVTAGGGSAYVRFGQFGGKSTLATSDLLTEDRSSQPTGSVFQTVRVVIPLAILIGLLVFRRRSIVTPLRLPKGRAVAFLVQRLGACAVDLAPFVLVAGLVLRLDWAEAVRRTTRWAFDPQSNVNGLPDGQLLLWWVGSASGYAVYSLAMELVARRTVGKWLARVEVLAEAGGPPAVWQIVVRNVLRFIEVLPPFWILGFFAVLSRNRQRVGDLFARTVAVRTTATASQDQDSSDK